MSSFTFFSYLFALSIPHFTNVSRRPSNSHCFIISGFGLFGPGFGSGFLICGCLYCLTIILVAMRGRISSSLISRSPSASVVSVVITFHASLTSCAMAKSLSSSVRIFWPASTTQRVVPARKVSRQRISVGFTSTLLRRFLDPSRAAESPNRALISFIMLGVIDPIRALHRLPSLEICVLITGKIAP